MLVQDILERNAEKRPEKPALLMKSDSVTFGELAEASDALGYFLVDNGINPGDRVMLILENSSAFVESYFGILKAGAVAVPLHTGIDEANFLNFLTHSEAKAVIAIPRLNSFLRNRPKGGGEILINEKAGSRDSGRDGVFFLDDILRDGRGKKPGARRIDLDVESIVYTSGSTGEPKGVMLTHLNTVSNMKSIVSYFGLADDDRIMAVLPFSYIYGKSLFLTHMLAGGSVVMNNNFVFPNTMLEEMKEKQVTGFAGVPSTYTILLHRSKFQDMKFPSLRYMCQAGGSLVPALQQQIRNIIHPAKFYVMYGATEAAPRLTYLEPDMLDRKAGSIGRAIPNVEVYIGDENGGRLPPGTEGEIVARGSNIMAGYWKDPVRTAEVIRNGLYFTGDMGTEDEEGFLYVTGRKRDFIKVKGFRVSAKEIEETLMSFKGIQETAVIGRPDALLGEAIEAFIVRAPESTFSEEDVRAFIGRTLPPYKIPSVITFLGSLPKNSSGKIMKPALMEIVRAESS